MGNPDSFAFCRLHDDNLTDRISLEDAANTVSVYAGLLCKIILKDGFQNEPFTKPMKAYIAAVLNPEIFSTNMEEYQACLADYGNDLSEVADKLHESLLPYLDHPEIGPKAELLVATFETMWGLNGSEEYLESARHALDKHLQREGSEDFNIGLWCFLAQMSDFEAWHDEKYGNHIEGLSKYYGKDENGNPIASQASTTSSSISGGGCYIATAVYGSYDCPQVWTLRRWRDQRLATSKLGKLFIRAYYAVSPMMVKHFGHTAWFSSFWKSRLDAMVARLNKEGYTDTPYTD